MQRGKGVDLVRESYVMETFFLDFIQPCVKEIVQVKGD